MLALCRKREVGGLVATEISRVGRLGAGQVTQALDELHRLGVRVVFTRQGLDYGTPTGQFVAGILAEVAKLERAQIRERVKAGIRRAQERGTRTGRPIGRPEVALDIERARKLRADGLSWRRVARAVGVNEATLRRKLTETG